MKRKVFGPQREQWCREWVRVSVKLLFQSRWAGVVKWLVGCVRLDLTGDPSRERGSNKAQRAVLRCRFGLNRCRGRSNKPLDRERRNARQWCTLALEGMKHDSS
jgi:hypothetical protein